MAYLRGSTSAFKVRRFKKPQTVQNKVALLERKVNALTPRRCYRQTTTSLSDGVGQYGYTDTDLTADYIASSTFRDDINGDSFTNLWLKLNYHATLTAVQQIRIIVYTPVRISGTFQPSKDSTGFVTLPDPAAFRVFADLTVKPLKETTAVHDQRMFVRLKNLKTIYNGSASVIEHGNVRVFVMWYNGTNGTGGVLGSQLCVRDT